MAEVDNQDLNRVLQQAFDVSMAVFQERGFRRQAGLSERRLSTVCRLNGRTVIHVATAHEETDHVTKLTDMRLWHKKTPVDAMDINKKEHWVTDSGIVAVEGECTLLKKRGSSSYGTEVADTFQATGVDVILVTTGIATTCVGTTICDGVEDGFCTIAVMDCIGDPASGVVAWKLNDVDARLADVVRGDDCASYLNTVNGIKNAA